MNDHDDDLFRDDLFRKEMTGVAPLKDDGRVRLSRPQPPQAAWICYRKIVAEFTSAVRNRTKSVTGKPPVNPKP